MTAWLAGIWAIKRHASQVPSHGPRQEPLRGTLNITVPTVIAGQVKPIRTTVEEQTVDERPARPAPPHPTLVIYAGNVRSCTQTSCQTRPCSCPCGRGHGCPQKHNARRKEKTEGKSWGCQSAAPHMQCYSRLVLCETASREPEETLKVALPSSLLLSSYTSASFSLFWVDV